MASEGLGVLAVARGADEEPFSRAIFRSSKRSPSSPPSRFTTRSSTRRRRRRKRLDHDLQIAHDIQRILLPASAPEIDGYQISGINIPARQVSGDYFDYIKVDEDHSAWRLPMSPAKACRPRSSWRCAAASCAARRAGSSSPADVLQKVNAQLYPDIKEDMFISMAYVILDQEQPRR